MPHAVFRGGLHADAAACRVVQLCSCRFSGAQALAQGAPPAPPVTVAKPIVRDVVDSDEFIGRFQAVDEVSVRSRVGGYLQEVHFKDGAMVKQGDLLFVIDQRPFVTALNEATASLEVAKSSLTLADAQFKRAQSLSTTGSQSASTLDDRRRDLVSAEANVRGAQAAVDRANLDMDFTKITAPLSGRIDRRLISVGNLVQADQTVLTTIVSLDPIDFYFDVDERRLLSYADEARKNGSALQQGGGGLDVTVTIADSARSRSRASSISPKTASTTKRARSVSAPASRTLISSCSPACSDAFRYKARTATRRS